MIIGKVGERRFYRHFGGIYRRYHVSKGLFWYNLIYKFIISKKIKSLAWLLAKLVNGGFTAISAGYTAVTMYLRVQTDIT